MRRTFTVIIHRAQHDPRVTFFKLHDENGATLFDDPVIWPARKTPAAARHWAKRRIRRDLDKKPGEVLYREEITA